MADAAGLQHGVSIVIPAWNDGERLNRTLSSYLPVLDGQGFPYEVIIVKDGVSDGHALEVDELVHGIVRQVRFETRLGKGGAIIQGFRQARFDRTGFVDADAPILPQDLVTLVDRLDTHEAAIAVRTPKRRVSPEPRGLLRRALSAGWKSSCKALFLSRVSDTQCGAKFFRTVMLRQILSAVAIRDWAFDLDLLYHWGKTGHSICEVQVSWRDDGDSRIELARAVPAMFVALIGLRLYHSPVRGVVPPDTVTRMYQALGMLTNGYTSGHSDGGQPAAVEVYGSPSRPGSAP